MYCPCKVIGASPASYWSEGSFRVGKCHGLDHTDLIVCPSPLPSAQPPTPLQDAFHTGESGHLGHPWFVQFFLWWGKRGFLVGLWPGHMGHLNVYPWRKSCRVLVKVHLLGLFLAPRTLSLTKTMHSRSIRLTPDVCPALVAVGEKR